MENTSTKQNISYILRGLVAFLFLFSAVAKLYPSPYFAISTFEMKQLVPLGFSEGLAVYLSRTLIGAEIALGLLLLQPNYLRKIVIPATIALLVVFIAHLLLTIFSGGNSGNCGCFGELLPMTPLESVFKNIATVGLLVWLYKLLPAGSDRKNHWVVIGIAVASILLVYLLAPIKAQTPITFEPTGPIPEEAAIDTATIQPADTIATTDVAQPQTPVAATTPTTPATATAATPAKAATPAAQQGPAQKKSVYSQFFANADKGKKIIALFVPGCDHCRDAAKQLTELRKKNKDFPEMSIIFMDEEAEKIPDFFTEAGAQYPYKVIDVVSFWKLLGNSKDTPGVLYLWNGNIIKEWEGIEGNKFTGAALMKELKK